VRLRNIELSTAKPDPRPPMIFDDAKDVRNEGA
jgi:hypothetical protein